MEEVERLKLENDYLKADVSALVVELSGWMHHADVLVKQLQKQQATVETQFYTNMDISMINRRIRQTKETIAKLRAQNTT